MSSVETPDMDNCPEKGFVHTIINYSTKFPIFIFPFQFPIPVLVTTMQSMEKEACTLWKLTNN